MLQRRQQVVVIALCLATAGLLVTIINCSVDLYWHLCERDVWGLRFPINRALAEALECSTRNDKEAHRYLERIENLAEEAMQAATIALKTAKTRIGLKPGEESSLPMPSILA